MRLRERGLSVALLLVAVVVDICVQDNGPSLQRPGRIGAGPRGRCPAMDMMMGVCGDVMRTAERLLTENENASVGTKEVAMGWDFYFGSKAKALGVPRQRDHVMRGGHPEQVIRYSRIYKAGNDFIRDQMNTFAKTREGVSSIASYTEVGNSSKTGKIAFTFVREPTDRLLSAYMELEFRTRKRKGKRGKHNAEVPFEREPEGSTARVARFLYDVLTLKVGNLFEPYHIWSQANVVWSKRMTYVGKVELMDAGLASLNDLIAGLSPPISDFRFANNRTFGSHKSSEHPAPKLRLGSLLRQEPEWQKAVCGFYLLDYAYFDYPLPVVCISRYDNLRRDMREVLISDPRCKL
eukprot:CAMPEP_0119139166 /NCGR_PEP_ID=MMETSP1310-20130426/27010_1 /TAXON_ID=464262 /ORGANISM="Genus nov. species nov., Strain RCC2339" /LENGTH=349 /DNA_ID=CAMNT_0007130429 /DNA_START=51 /DNA_END=1100 /DNA_ORIENTATION=+